MYTIMSMNLMNTIKNMVYIFHPLIKRKKEEIIPNIKYNKIVFI